MSDLPTSKERLYDEAFSLLQRAQALLERAQKRHTELEAMNTALIKGIASLDSSPDEPRAAYAVCGEHVDEWQSNCNACKSAQAERDSSAPPPPAGLNKVLEPEKYGNGYRVSLIFLSEENAAAAYLELDRPELTKGAAQT